MSDQIEKRWIILRNPGKVPVIKIPKNTDAGMLEMIVALKKYHPEGQLTTVEMAFGGDLWVNDGHEMYNQSLVV